MRRTLIGMILPYLTFTIILFFFLVFLDMCVFLSCDLRDEDEVESFLAQIRQLNGPWSLSENSADALFEARLR